MQFYIKFIRSNTAFLIPYLILLLCLLPVLLIVPRLSLHLLINRYQSSFADLSFTCLTYLGDGLTPFVIALFFAFFSFRNALKIVSAGTLAGIIAQILKRLVFPGIKRPYFFFKDLPDYHWVEGVSMHSSFSFPSGHAATIFAVCLIVAGLTHNKILKILLFFLAFLIAFSRVYLSQHFMIDIYAGSLIGILSSVLIFVIFDGFKAKWLDSSLLKLTKKNIRNE